MFIKVPVLTVKNCNLSVLSVLTAIVMVSLFPHPSNAQLMRSLRVNLRFPPVTDLGAPKRTSGAGSRGPACSSYQFNNSTVVENIETRKIPLTALTPGNNLITTAEPQATVFVYIPNATDKNGTFRLIDIKTEQIVYQQSISFVTTPGIVKISIPETVQLQQDSIYQWQVLVICNPQDREADELVEGWIKYTPLTSEQATQIQKLMPNSLAQVRLYAQFGFWNQALVILDQLRKNNSQAQVLWQELLTYVRLAEIAEVSN
ncbi:MAG: DUF928 domain-containing protein [Sphaerospermopsis sp. SIO1G1]|nr:DUF928 domain-containing protein [Sphaerospermopsis sp. SIO1G1]